MELVDYLAAHLAPATIKRYLQEITLLQASLPQAQQARFEDLTAYLGEQRQSRASQLKVILAALKRYYDYLYEQGHRPDHPAKGISIKNPPTPLVDVAQLFTPQELEKILGLPLRYATSRNRLRLIGSFLIYQGLTCGEICRLQLQDVELGTGNIFIRGTARTQERVLALKAVQVHYLQEYLQKERPGHPPSQALLLNGQGKAEQGEGVRYVLRRAKSLFAGRKLNAKTVRQSVIVHLLKKGHDLRVVQAFAGHKYPSSTERYRTGHLEALQRSLISKHPLG